MTLQVKQCLDMSGVASVPTSETLNNQVGMTCVQESV